jgi:hypothetical protein
MTARHVPVVPVSAAYVEPLAALFARADVACHCRYWHFAGTTNDWLARVAHAPEENAREMRAALEAGSEEMLGVVALAGDDVVGWLKVAPVSVVAKLYAQRPYRRLPCFEGDRTGVLAIGCLLVDPAYRHRGVVTALVDGAVALGISRGARAIEAFPRRAEGMRDEEAWMGPFSVFSRAGFEVVNDSGPYPVLRRTLSPAPPDPA